MDCQLSRPRAGGFWDRETDLQNLRSRHVRHSPAKLLLLAMEGCLFQKAERKLPLQPKSSPIATEFVPARTQRCGDYLDVAHQNSSREDPPEYASAAWDHWTGRDCAAGRPSRSLCLDLTSGPPLDAPASHSHPTPPEHGHRFMYRAVPECTWGVDFNKAGDRLKRYHCPSGTPPMGPSLQTGST